MTARRDHSEFDARVLRLSQGEEGVSTADVAGGYYTVRIAGERVDKLRSAGLIFTGSRGIRTKRHFSTAAAAKKWEEEGAEYVPVRIARVAKLDPSLPAFIPPGLKVTQCPNFVDRRFQPAPDFERVITADWYARRLAEAKP